MGMAKQSTSGPVALPVLLTRPMAQSQAFAASLAARFGQAVRPVISPLMVPVFLTPKLPDGPFAGVIFTSATGVEVSMAFDLPKRAFCVGAQTAARARAAGFQAVSANGDAAALVAAILADPPHGRLLHLRGEDARGDIAETLTSAGTETVSAVVYRQDPQPLTDEALTILALDGAVIVPLFSPRSALLFRAALPPDRKASLWMAGISGAVAETVDGVAQRLEIARKPDADAMLDAVAALVEIRPAP